MAASAGLAGLLPGLDAGTDRSASRASLPLTGASRRPWQPGGGCSSGRAGNGARTDALLDGWRFRAISRIAMDQSDSIEQINVIVDLQSLNPSRCSPRQR